MPVQSFENHLIIERPRPDVFEFVADFENMPKWNYFVIDVDNVSDQPPAVGTRFHQVRKTDQQDYEIVELEPNERVAVETLPPAQPLRMSFRFESVPSGTHLIDRWEFDPDVPGPLQWLATRRVKSAVSDNLKKLKQLLETGEVRLQDGRQVAL
jgi:uncharacterized membrane protein